MSKTQIATSLNDSWKIHTPNLLNEVLNNQTTWALEKPLQIFANKLSQVAARAIELQDKELLKLCCDLTLLEESDPKSPEYNPEMIKKLFGDAK